MNTGQLISASRHRFWILFSGIIILFCLTFVIDLAMGPVRIPFLDVIKILFGKSGTDTSISTIIYDFRLPRVITAVFCGAALAVSGLQMQTLFRNPIAGPYILGVSSGASLGVALLVLSTGSLTMLNSFFSYGSWGLVFGAIAGATLVMFVMLFISSRVSDVTTILIVGMMLGSAVSAFVGILQYYSESNALKAFTIWSFGSLSGVAWQQIGVMIPVITIGLVISFLIIKPMNLLLLGESYAKSSGLNVRQTRLLIIITTGILSGGITAFCGPIGFIGTAIPHISRMMFRTTDHRILVPTTILSGATLVLICDIIAQAPKSQGSLPINSVTAIIGAPIVIWIIMRGRGAKGYFR